MGILYQFYNLLIVDTFNGTILKTPKIKGFSQKLITLSFGKGNISKNTKDKPTVAMIAQM